MSTISRGNRNLLLLGGIALLLTLISTSTSLWLYHDSGDIYLDRSRPGFLPDAQEIKEDKPEDTNYTFSENGGDLDIDELDEYLKQLKTVTNRLESLEAPYAKTPLSDESLGIVPMPEIEENKEN